MPKTRTKQLAFEVPKQLPTTREGWRELLIPDCRRTIWAVVYTAQHDLVWKTNAEPGTKEVRIEAKFIGMIDNDLLCLGRSGTGYKVDWQHIVAVHGYSEVPDERTNVLR